MLLALVVGGLAILGRRPDRALGVLAIALAVETGVDCVYFVQASQGSYVEGGLLDAAWMLVAMLFATAAVQRASAAPSPPSHRGRSPEAMIGAFAAVGVALLAYDAVAEIDPTAKLLVVGAVAAIMLRLALALREVRRLEHNRVEAHTDELTGLANRRQFYASADQLLESPDAHPVGLLLIDLDQFKQFNDTLGHGSGDALLREFAHRLTFALPGTATVARLGGDEFVVLLPDSVVADAIVAAQRVQDTLESPFHPDGITTPVSASIGIAVFPDHGRDRTDLMRHADIAMYEAKLAGTGIKVFGEDDPATDPEPLVLAGGHGLS